MRFEIIRTIYQQALKNSNIIFMTGDLGHAYLEDFRRNLPQQYINSGIAEQNMIGIAAGFALSGNRVFVYSIAPFIVMRCYEQIRIDICSQNVGVVVIGVGVGYAYSTCGSTHNAIEDIAVMRALPNMRVYSPSNPLEARLITEYLLTASHPAYLRIGKGGEPKPEKDYPIEIGKGLVAKPGHDITIFSTGTIISEAVEASHILEKHGISTEVINIHTIKPLDEALVQDRVGSRNGIFVLEEHNIMGGLGESIARVICELGSNKKLVFRCFGVPDQYNHKVGSQKFMRSCYGLNAVSLAEQILQLFKA
ncbi:MAG: hypothetical protein HY506_01540 [Candidatus Yanofskybacteria bacterium]|nr:hypothetical protein [Candidatus Yanofskybacteria bacterium]